MNNLYFIVDKNLNKIVFKKNRAQEHFDKHKHTRNIILKSRRLGFTTFEAIDALDDTLFDKSMNFSSLFIAHTQNDAIEIFDKKIDYAFKNIPEEWKTCWSVDASTANKLKFGFGNNNFSSIIVSNSGRSGTNNRVHSSEYAKLCAKYPSKADEFITGTIPSVPPEGRIDIESTAEGMSGNYYDLFSEAWARRDREPGQLEFKAHFYNWTWDDEEIAKIKVAIPLEEMEESNRFKEYQERHNLSDIEITYYYTKWLSLKKNWDNLHQEYPTTPEEAFIASGNTFFNKERIMLLMSKVVKPLKLDPKGLPEGLMNYYVNDELKIFSQPDAFGSYVIGADVSEGKLGDGSPIKVIDNKTLKAVAKFNSNTIRPDDFAKLLNELGRWYNNAYLGVESNTGLWVLTELFEKYNYPNLYWREAEDDVSHRVGRQLGFATTAKSRKPMLDNLLVQVNLYDDIWDEDFLAECLTFVRNDQGRPEAAIGKHDDEIIATGICYYIRENAPAEMTRPMNENLTAEQRLMRRLQEKKEQGEFNKTYYKV